MNEAVQKDMTLNCTLADNIDLTGKEWTQIGTHVNNAYTGTFDGAAIPSRDCPLREVINMRACSASSKAR